MPTTHTVVFDGIVARMSVLLPTHKRLANPYDPSRNDLLRLTQGWGLAISPSATNTNRFVCNLKSYSITYVLVITRKMDALNQDAARRMIADKALVTDFEAILNDAHANNLEATPGGGAHVKAVGFDGISNVFTDEGEDVYRALFCNLEIEIFNS